MAIHNIEYRHLEEAYRNCKDAIKKGCDCSDLLDRIERIKENDTATTRMNISRCRKSIAT